MMRHLATLLVVPLTSFAFVGCASEPVRSSAPANQATLVEPIVYPVAPRSDVVDIYHGVEVADPFRPLEDVDSEATKRWVAQQNELTEGFLEQVDGREDIRARLTELWDHERFGIPYKYGEDYFFTYNDGLMPQSVICRTRGLDGEREVVLDPNRLSHDGTISLGGWVPSDDGRYLAYGLSDGGSDWRTWRVRDLASGEDLADELKWVKFSRPSWTKDGRGFYYSRYPEVEDALQAELENNKLYFHRVGTAQVDDTLVFQDLENKKRGYHPQVTEDGRFLVLTISEGTERKNRLYVRDLEAGERFVRVFDAFDASYSLIANDGWNFWLRTDRDAARGRVVRVDASRPDPELTEIIPEQAETLSSVSLVGGRLLASYLKDAKTLVRSFAPDGTAHGNVELPGMGSAGGFNGRRSDPETFYSFTSYTTPRAIYRYDVASGKSALFARPNVDFEADRFETRQVHYTSKDGTNVPMFITHARSFDPEQPRPTLLYGYGGFNVSLTPAFSAQVAAWLELGGVYVVANLRGGGEYGREWHEAGTRERKQNVFDDFIAAAEWLIAEGYTTREQLAIQGGSNGGLLVGAVTNQRPDLFAAALPAVGVMDMLRYHRFTIGWAWASDYGTSDEPDMFPVLRKYSPLHNVRPGVQYPATMVTTADHDDRVVPGHSFKYAAALQAAQAGRAPILARISTRAGHGAGRSTTQRIDAATDELAFLTWALGMASGARL